MQINRLFEIVYLLLEKERVTAKELAEHFEVSTRTVYRDIEILSGAGIPVYMSKGKGGGVSLLPGFILDKAIITEDEKEEILSALKAVDSVRPGEEDATLRKMGSLFGGASSDWIEVDFGTWSDGEREAGLFRMLKEAILGKRVIRFSYASAKGEVTRRETEPLKLVYKGASWHLYGYCRERQDFRFFKLKRMRDPEVTGEKFIRKYWEPALEETLRGDRRKHPADMVNLKLKIEKEAAYRVYDEFEQYEQMEDGSFLVNIALERNGWLLYYLLSFGSALEILETEEIRQWFQGEVGNILKRYS